MSAISFPSIRLNESYVPLVKQTVDENSCKKSFIPTLSHFFRISVAILSHTYTLILPISQFQTQ